MGGRASSKGQGLAEGSSPECAHSSGGQPWLSRLVSSAHVATEAGAGTVPRLQ